MNQEEILKTLKELGYPLEELRKYPWFERGEGRPDIDIDSKNVFSQGREYEGQEYLFPTVATPFEARGIPFRDDYLVDLLQDEEFQMNEVISEKFHLGENWGIPVESQEQGNLLGDLIHQYMGSLGGF